MVVCTEKWIRMANLLKLIPCVLASFFKSRARLEAEILGSSPTGTETIALEQYRSW